LIKTRFLSSSLLPPDTFRSRKTNVVDGRHERHDTDEDGMPDDYERLYGPSALDASDATGDSDGDGISNRDEYQARTCP